MKLVPTEGGTEDLIPRYQDRSDEVLHLRLAREALRPRRAVRVHEARELAPAPEGLAGEEQRHHLSPRCEERIQAA